MPRYTFSVTVLVAGVSALCLGYTLYPRHRSVPRPHIIVSTTALHLEVHAPATTARGTVTITNGGTSDLAFQISPSCNCSTVSPRKGQLKPGERSEIVATVRLAPSTRTKTAALKILSNDPHSPRTHIDVQIRSVRPLEAIPPELNLGRLTLGQRATACLLVTGPNSSALSTDVSLDLAAPNSSLQISTPEKTDGGHLRYTITASGTPHDGRIADVLTATDNRGNTLQIPFSAEYVPLLTVAPTTVAHSRLVASSIKVVVMRNDGEPLPQHEHVDHPAGIVIDEIRRPGAAYRRVYVISAARNSVAVAEEPTIRWTFPSLGGVALHINAEPEERATARRGSPGN